MINAMTNGKYIIDHVSHDQLHPASYEPDERMKANMAFNKLKESIQKIGLQYPPLVSRQSGGNSFVIVDGHRRIAAMKALQWSSIPVLVTDQGSPDELFAAVSGTVKQLNASEWLEVYLKGGILPGGATKTNIRRLDEVMGREFLWNLHRAGLRPSIWSLAARTIKYISLDDSLDNKRRILTWISKHRITQQVNAWITGQNSVNALRTAFLEDRPPTMM